MFNKLKSKYLILNKNVLTKKYLSFHRSIYEMINSKLKIYVFLIISAETFQ